MKVVINVCFGGFGLSALATKRIAELNGKECYFFRNSYKHLGDETPYKHLISITMEEASKGLGFFSAYDIPNPNEVMQELEAKEWHSMSDAEKKEHNDLYAMHSLYYDRQDRTNPQLIQVIEELGDKANGGCAKLRIIEIPDGVEYEIDEYDGNEHIAETHRTWR